MTQVRFGTATPALPMLFIVIVLACPFAGLSSAFATEVDDERAQLAALERQLEILDHLPIECAALGHTRSRYHFDYPRLRADLERIRAGVRDYLTPSRAQPRDWVELSGRYRTEAPEAAP